MSSSELWWRETKRTGWVPTHTPVAAVSGSGFDITQANQHSISP
jgi:hypothetical protein